MLQNQSNVQLQSLLFNICCSLFIYLFMYFLICKGGYVFGSVGLSVCLFVCLSEDNITQKVMNGLG